MAKNMSYGDMQHVIYEYTIKRMTPGRKDLCNDILYLSKISDTFWVEQFDEMYNALTAYNPNEERILDAVSFAFEAVSERVSEYYSNAWNFPPGHKPIELPMLSCESISDNTIHKLLKKMAPTTLAKIRAKEKAQRDARVKKLKAEAKLHKPLISGAVAAVIKLSKRSWAELHKAVITYKDCDISSFIDGLSTADVTAVNKSRSGAQVKRIVKAALKPDQYVENYIYNVRETVACSNIPNFELLGNQYSRAAITKELLKHYNNGVDF